MRYPYCLLALLLICHHVQGLRESKTAKKAFDCRIVGIYKDVDDRMVLLKVQQSLPRSVKYMQDQISDSYQIQLRCLNEDMVQMYVHDPRQKVYRMPEEEPYPSLSNLKQFILKPERIVKSAQKEVRLSFCKTIVTYQNINNYLEIRISQRNRDNHVLVRGLRLENKFVHFELVLNSLFVMGLGERNGKFKIEQGNYTMWAKDNMFAVQRDLPCQNTYGYHPVMMYRDLTTEQFNLLYLRSTGAVEMEIIKRNNQQQIITQMHSNFVQLLLFSNKNPKKLVSKYHEYIGAYKLPPLWYFGFHQSRWGYSNSAKLIQVAEGYANAGLKLESIFLDIDYMQNKKPFKIDTQKFELWELKELKNEFGVKLVPIVDFAFNSDFPIDLNQQLTENLLVQNDIMDFFLRDFRGQPYIGNVWPGASIFPDFTHPGISVFWKAYLKYLHQSIPFDGVWLDMNEIANFAPVYQESYDYSNVFLNCNQRFYNMTLPLSLMHQNQWPEYYAHNLNGILQQRLTEKIGTRLFGDQFYFISRNTFPGSGRYGGHWSGDNEATEQYLDYSMSSLMNFNLFGVPFVGVDVCGFYKNFEQGLCCKWIKVNSLFPLFRNHNHQAFTDQQFFKIGEKIKHTFSVSMDLRYSLVKYIYSLFVQRSGKGMVYSPIMFSFLDEYSILSQDIFIENQLMIGDNIFFSNSDFIYFPRNIAWFNYRTGDQVVGHNCSNRYVNLETDVTDELLLFVKEGAIIIEQDARLVTKIDQLNNVYTLRCYLDRQGGCVMTHYDQRQIKSIRKKGQVNETALFKVSIQTETHISISLSSQTNSKQSFLIDKVYLFGTINIVPSKYLYLYPSFNQSGRIKLTTETNGLLIAKKSGGTFRLCNDKSIMLV